MCSNEEEKQLIEKAIKQAIASVSLEFDYIKENLLDDKKAKVLIKGDINNERVE